MMKLYEEWSKQLEGLDTQDQYNKFWGDYLPKETACYQKLIGDKQQVMEGSLQELAASFELDNLTFVGFLDGISESIEEELDLDALEADTALKLTINWEKLLWNMHKAKADWLYGLEEWAGIFDEKQRKEIRKDYNRSTQVIKPKKIGRNEPCPCGSGKKYKKCCGKNA
jgi:hypothetical protein